MVGGAVGGAVAVGTAVALATATGDEETLRLLQTVVETSNIERQRGEYSRQLDRLSDQRRSELLREAQEATSIGMEAGLRFID